MPRRRDIDRSEQGAVAMARRRCPSLLSQEQAVRLIVVVAGVSEERAREVWSQYGNGNSESS